MRLDGEGGGKTAAYSASPAAADERLKERLWEGLQVFLQAKTARFVTWLHREVQRCGTDD